MKRSDFKKKYEELIYLGDSVYVRFDGYHIVLETHNGYDDDPRNRIALEPSVLRKLAEYSMTLYKESENLHD